MMKTNTRKLQVLATAASFCAFNAFGQATSDEKPAPSIYDQFPDCMNRGQVAAGNPAPCELPAPVSGRRARAPLGSNVSSADATVPQNITASAGNNSVSTTSSATTQPSAASRLRAAR